MSARVKARRSKSSATSTRTSRSRSSAWPAWHRRRARSQSSSRPGTASSASISKRRNGTANRRASLYKSLLSTAALSSNPAARPIKGQRPFGASPLLLVMAAALLWSTGGLFIKLSHLFSLELSFGRPLFAAITVAIWTRREGLGINRLTIITSLLYPALLLLFVIATKETTAANAIFLQYTAPIYMLVFEPLLYKEKFRRIDLVVVAVCVAGMSLFFIGELKPGELQGNMAALASGLCMAFYFLLLRHARSREVKRASSVIYGNLILVL